jgi:RNA polymerase-binding transcription factor
VPQCPGADGGGAGRTLKEVELTAVKKSTAGTSRTATTKKPAAKPAVTKAPAKRAAAKATAKATPTKKAASTKKAVPKAPAKKTPAPTRAAKASAPARAGAATKAAKATTTKATTKTTKAAKATTTKATTTKKTPAATKSPTGTKAAKVPAATKAAVKKPAPEAPKRPTVGPYAKETKFLDAQRVLLLEERAIYAGQAVDLRAEADSLALEREPGDVQFDEESGEGGTVTVDRERNLALSAQAIAAVEEIDDALTKLDRKTYGFCERCFQPIPKARLQALPFARLCVACKSGGLSRR